MQIRIPARKIDEAWPERLHALFEAHGVKLMPESVRFAEPCNCHWDVATGDLIVEQS